MDWGYEDVLVNGQSLKTYRWGLRNTGALDQLAPRRGSNTQMAYARGESWRAKRMSSVTRTLDFWIDARNEDGTYDSLIADRIAQLNQNIRDLSRLFTAETSQLSIARQVILPTGTETWEALAEPSGGMIFTSTEDSIEERFASIDLLFADPVWYGETVDETITGTTVVTNPGEIDALQMVVSFSGGTNYSLRNTSIDPNPVLSFTGTGSVDIDCGAGTAFQGVTNVIGNVSVAGTKNLFVLQPGDNSLTVTGGTAHITFRAPRF